MAATERTLYLLPVWLGKDGGAELIPAANKAVAEQLTLFFAEHERSARRSLRRMSPGIDLDAIEIHRLDKDTKSEEIAHMADLLNVKDGAIISEAGMPCIADPGALLVAAAHKRGIRVVPLSGPSSLLLALSASGLNGQLFTFHGYLSRDGNERKRMIRSLELDAQRTGGAQLFIETPYRNKALLDALLSTCADRTLLCIAVDIGQQKEEIRTLSIAQWRSQAPAVDDRPAVFILGSNG